MESDIRTFTPNENMLRDYVLQKLSPEDDELIELWLMDHPEVIGDLRSELAFAHHLKPQPESTPSPKVSSGFFDWLLIPQAAFNIFLFLSIGAAVGYGTRSIMSPHYHYPNTLVEAQTIFLEKTRSTSLVETSDTVHIREKNMLLIFEIDILAWADMDYSYEILLHTNNEQIKYNLKKTNNTIIQVALPASSIKSENILIELIGKDNNAETHTLARYSKKIVITNVASQ